jgi:hypothetical protein
MFMAQRRMFSMGIMDSDAFLDMPTTSQLLYVHLGMRADDEGFIGNPKSVMRVMGASEDDLKILMAKRFVLSFESGVIVMKHWRMHNTIRMDRFAPTVYREEREKLRIKPNRSYTFSEDGVPLAPIGVYSGNQMATRLPQVKLSKDNINRNTEDVLKNMEIRNATEELRKKYKPAFKEETFQRSYEKNGAHR